MRLKDWVSTPSSSRCKPPGAAKSRPGRPPACPRPECDSGADQAARHDEGQRKGTEQGDQHGQGQGQGIDPRQPLARQLQFLIIAIDHLHRIGIVGQSDGGTGWVSCRMRGSSNTVACRQPGPEHAGRAGRPRPRPSHRPRVRACLSCACWAGRAGGC
jgi:hypothetical protein